MSFAVSVAYEVSVGLRCAVCEKPFGRTALRHFDARTGEGTHPWDDEVGACVVDGLVVVPMRANGPCDRDGDGYGIPGGLPHRVWCSSVGGPGPFASEPRCATCNGNGLVPYDPTNPMPCPDCVPEESA
jgi:hypothetical protein